MNNPFTTLKHLGLGAGMMYFFDPARGARRRAWLAEQTRGAMNELGSSIDRGMRDLRNRTQGTMAETRARFMTDEADDRVIVERARSRMGHWISNPRAISVRCAEGVVTLSGPILQAEADDLLEVIAGVRGVREVIDRLERHDQPNGHPSLQGGKARRHETPAVCPMNWSPATKLMVGTAGAVAGLALIRRSGLTLPALAMTGAVWALCRAEGDPLERFSEMAGRCREFAGHEHGGEIQDVPMAQQGGLI